MVFSSGREAQRARGIHTRRATRRPALGFQVPAAEGDVLRGGCQVFPGVQSTPQVPSLVLPPPTPTGTAHFGLFAQCLVFVQPFNSLHQREHKYQPAAEPASLGRHPTIQGLSCLEMGADAANIVGMSFTLITLIPVRVGRMGSSG